LPVRASASLSPTISEAEIEPKPLAIRFTRRVRHNISFPNQVNMLIIVAKSSRKRLKLLRHRANAGFSQASPDVNGACSFQSRHEGGTVHADDQRSAQQHPAEGHAKAQVRQGQRRVRSRPFGRLQSAIFVAI